MSSFNVKTPDEWKEKLYAKTVNKKAVRIRPITIVAAVLAVIIGISGSAFAVKVSKAPEYFGSMFLGNSEIANEVYSEKDYYFSSDRDDLTLKCKGIAGDSYSVFILFELKSKGEIVFDKNKSYDFESHDQIIPFMSSLGKSGYITVVDEQTLEIGISFSDVSGVSMAGNTATMYFEDITVYEKNTFNKVDEIECEFSGEIVIDYHNSVTKFKPTDNTVDIVGVEFKPIKGKISNFHFDYTLEVVDDEELFAGTDDHKMVRGNLTLNYADGTSEDFRLKMPPEKPDDVSASVIGKGNDKLHIILVLPKPINAAKVTSAKLNGIELFTE